MNLEQKEKKPSGSARGAGAEKRRVCGRGPLGIHRVPGLCEPRTESGDMHGGGYDRALDREHDDPPDGEH
nr:MAG TPA: hypothetical protein [Caudoviricetes sp.]